MDTSDVKIGVLNGFALGFSLGDIESFVSILMCLVAMSYTLYKWLFLWKKNRNKCTN